jgi:6-pyruvoyltetrahydropterin/6-carboxytetrahydropterin synthase
VSFELSQQFNFDAAHTLTRTVPLAEFEPSRRIHGHSYTATVCVIGERGPSGMVEVFSLKKNKRRPIDLFYLRQAIEVVRDELDHRFLDEVEGLGAGTLENLCVFIFERLAKEFQLAWVSVERKSTGDACRYSK